MTETKQLKLPSRIESVEEAALKAEKIAREWGYDDEFVSALDLAVRESVANAVKHGNKFAEDKPVEVTFTQAEDGMAITVRDYGSGFAPEDIPDPTNPENLLKANGRGILFMRSFMDEVEWSSPHGGGLIVRMLKRQ